MSLVDALEAALGATNGAQGDGVAYPGQVLGHLGPEEAILSTPESNVATRWVGPLVAFAGGLAALLGSLLAIWAPPAPRTSPTPRAQA